jgi:hypothetical protein
LILTDGGADAEATLLFPGNLTFPLFLEFVCLVEADQSFAMWYATAFAIHQNVGYGGTFSTEELAYDFLFLLIVQTVDSDDT